VSLSGVTLRALIQVAGQMDLAGRPLRLELDHLRQLRLPAILHWDMSHFVVLVAVGRTGITIHDPATGERSLTFLEASKHLTGVALELAPAAGFARLDERARLPLSVFWSHLGGNGHALLQVLVLSAVLQLMALAAPFYLQITVDEVIARGDADLLLVLALGFAVLAAIRAVTSALRGLVLLVVQNVVQFQLGARLFRHLIRLPSAFFEKRHVGDILSRFGSLQPIRTILAEGIITAVLDGVMAVLTLAMIFIYSGQLALIVLTAVLLYAAVRLALYRVFVAAHRSHDPGRSPGKLDLHRNRARDSEPEALQPGKRARGPVVEPVRRGRQRQRTPRPRQGRVQHDQRPRLRP